MVNVKAEVEVVLSEGEWEQEALHAVYDILQAFSIERLQVSPEDARILVLDVTTNFDDDESTAETAAYCIGEDLADAGFWVEEVRVVWGEPRL